MELLKPPQWLYDLMPRAIKSFFDVGGWYLVLLLGIALVLGIVALVLRRFFGLFGGGSGDAERALIENLANYPPPPKSGPRALLVDGQDARLRLVVFAPSGRGQTIDAARSDGMLELVLKGLGAVAQQDKPRIKVWPAQLSHEGFRHTFHRSVKKAEPDGKASCWVLLAGPAKVGKQVILVGMALQTEDPNLMGKINLTEARWGELLRVKLVKDT